MSYEKSKALIDREAESYIENHKKYVWFKAPSSIYGLETLKLLNVKGITTFEPLKEYTHLKAIEFGTTDCVMTIDTLNGLDANKGVTDLTFMCKTKVNHDIEVIGKMRSLTKLGLYNVVQAVSEDLLASLDQLKSVSLSKDNYQSITVLPENLASISLNFDAISVLPKWNTCPSLTRISLGANTSAFTDLDSLTCFPNLEILQMLSPKRLTDIGILRQFASLKEVDLNFSSVADLSALAQKKHLESLKLRGSAVSSIQEMFPVPTLKDLYLEKSKLECIDGIKENLPNLECLWIWETKVKDLNPLAGMTSIKELDVTLLKPKSWDFIATLTGLHKLDLCKTNFADVHLLMELPELKEVRFSKSKTDVTTEAYKKLIDQLESRGGKVI